MQPTDLQGSSRPHRVAALDTAQRISHLANQKTTNLVGVFLTHMSQDGGERRKSIVGVTHCVTRHVSGHVFSFKLINR